VANVEEVKSGLLRVVEQAQRTGEQVRACIDGVDQTIAMLQAVAVGTNHPRSARPSPPPSSRSSCSCRPSAGHRRPPSRRASTSASSAEGHFRDLGRLSVRGQRQTSKIAEMGIRSARAQRRRLLLVPRPARSGAPRAVARRRTVDVAIVGGGFTGLWTAYYLKRADPTLEVAVIEREFAGFGASGRNGGGCRRSSPVRGSATRGPAGAPPSSA
jgi:hypothetical protein